MVLINLLVTYPQDVERYPGYTERYAPYTEKQFENRQ